MSGTAGAGCSPCSRARWASSAAAGAGRPGEDVVLYVLEGEVEIVADRERETLRPGQSRSLDRGVPRRLRAHARSRVLALLAPAGLEELLAIAADPATDPDDRAALLAVGGV